MPNWIENKLEVSISDETLDRGKAQKEFDDFMSLLGENKEFSLNAIKPTPKELLKIASPTNVVSDDEFKEIDEEENNFMGQKIYISKSLSDKLIEKYNYNNWYDWNVCNWGCKWDVCNFVLIETWSHFYKCEFLTPWSPPDVILDYLRKKYPNLCFDNEWEDIG